MTAPVVLVTGIGGPAGASLAAQFHQRGFEVHGTDCAPIEDPAFCAVTRVPPARHPDFAHALTELARTVRADLIVPTVTEELPVLAVHGLGGFPLVLGSAAAVAIADDKWHTARALSAAGVPVPRSAPGDCADEPVGGPAGEGRWISKPRQGRGGRGVAVHDGLAPALAAAGPLGLVQEFAPGAEYAVQLHVLDGGQADRVAVLHKLVRTHGAVGNGTAVERVLDAADAGVVALRAARAIGLRGPVDVDVRRLADGTPAVLEINARFGAHSAHAPELLDAVLADHGLLADHDLLEGVVA